MPQVMFSLVSPGSAGSSTGASTLGWALSPTLAGPPPPGSGARPYSGSWTSSSRSSCALCTRSCVRLASCSIRLSVIRVGRSIVVVGSQGDDEIAYRGDGHNHVESKQEDRERSIALLGDAREVLDVSPQYIGQMLAVDSAARP